MLISFAFFKVKKMDWNWVNNQVVTVDDETKEVNKFNTRTL